MKEKFKYVSMASGFQCVCLDGTKRKLVFCVASWDITDVGSSNNIGNHISILFHYHL